MPTMVGTQRAQSTTTHLEPDDPGWPAGGPHAVIRAVRVYETNAAVCAVDEVVALEEEVVRARFATLTRMHYELTLGLFTFTKR